ncbi:uncharacterized protein LOC144128760 [Amblyomma americanum]
MAEKSEQDLTTSSGIVKFKELWNSNITCHGINFHVAQSGELEKFKGYAFLQRVWYLQRVMAGFRGKQWLVPYILAGFYLISTDYRQDRKNLTDALRDVGRSSKVNLLVLNTHSMKHADQIPYQLLPGQRCVVTGPTPMYGDKSSDISLVCSNELQNRKHESKPLVETALMTSIPGTIVAWESAAGVLDKAGNMTKWLPKVELGFSVDHVEYSYVAAKAQFKCQNLSDYPIVSAVRNATGKPPLEQIG